MLRILIADDHPLFREGLSRLVTELDTELALVEAGDFTEAIRLAREEGPFDLILSDLKMPGMDEFAGIRGLREAAASVPIVVVSGFESRANLERSLEAGAQGFLPKTSPPSVMVNALRLVLLGEIYVPPSLFSSDAKPTEAASASLDSARSAMEMRANVDMLTQRQLGVLALIGQGLSNRDIADRLQISEGTVKVHVGAILKTLGVSNRTQAALLATDLGITTEPGS
ncbi:MAG: response regulator transcription factor, partial [Alphaproteobacteria bacterium]|nr:response regulator transcription factor [Alphaproteobacteria bacterium]